MQSREAFEDREAPKDPPKSVPFIRRLVFDFFSPCIPMGRENLDWLNCALHNPLGVKQSSDDAEKK